MGPSRENRDLPAVDPTDRFASRVRGCLLGGAIGDALGAPIEFLDLAAIRERFGPAGLTDLVPAYGRLGAITDDTQMTLFTAEGLIRAWVRGESRGVGSPPGVVRNAYLRWLRTQDSEPIRRSEHQSEVDTDDEGWLLGERWLHARRAPGNTCLAALRAAFPDAALRAACSDAALRAACSDAALRAACADAPLQAANDSKGCGGVMRIAPVGLLPHGGNSEGGPTPIEQVFHLGVELAALTHGHPSGQLPAGVMAATLFGIVHQDLPLPRALEAAMRLARPRAHSGETLAALEAAADLAAAGSPTPEAVESLGGGWVAEEALAIAVYAVLSEPDDLRSALLLAANHSGDSDSTASLAGQLLGAVHGERRLPADWLAALEGRETITRLADDFTLQMTGCAPQETNGWQRSFTKAWFARYPPV